MKILGLMLVVAGGLAFAMTARAATALVAQEQHPAHAHEALPPAPAQRWTPDAPLREGMRRARAAVEALRGYEAGRMGAADAVRQAAQVESAVVFMFANCRLAAAPDAALHGILVPLLTAAQALQAHPQERAAVASMRDAIAAYPRYFDDPDWAEPAPRP